MPHLTHLAIFFIYNLNNVENFMKEVSTLTMYGAKKNVDLPLSTFLRKFHISTLVI